MLRVFLSLLMFSMGLTVCAQDSKPPVRKGEKKLEKVALALNTGGHTSTIASMAFTPDGKKLVTCEHTNVHVWKLPEGELERTWRLPSVLHMIAVSPNGATIATMGNVEDNPVWLLDLATGGTKSFDIEGVRGHFGINSLAFSPDGKRLAWCTWFQAGAINIQQERVSHKIKRDGETYSVAFDQTGERLLVNGGNDPRLNQFQVYDAKPGKDAKDNKLLFELDGSTSDHGRVTWSSDNKYFAGWFRDRGSKIFVWDAEGKLRIPEGKKEGRLAVTLPGGFYIHHVQFVGPEKLVAVGTNSAKVRAYLINAATHKVEKTTDFGWENPQDADLVVAVSPTGTQFAVTSSPGFRVQLFDLEAGERLPDVGHSFPMPERVAWGPDSRSISWSLGKDRKGDPIPRRGLNLSTLTLLNEKQVAGFKGVNHIDGYSLEFDENKRKLFIVHDKKRIETAFNSPVTQYTFYKDADDKLKLVVLGKWNGPRLSIIDPETGKLTDISEYSDGTAISASPDGKYLLVAKHDQALTIYRLDNHARVLRVLVADQDWVVWTPSGYYAATFNGERMIGFTSRTDRTKPLTFYPVERFRKQLYQPEMIKLVLDKGAAAAIKATKTQPVEIEKVLPPSGVLELVSQKDNLVKVKIAATSVNGKPVEALRLQLDGHSLPNNQGYFEPKADQKAEATWEITIPPGTHQLSVLVRGSDSSDRSNSVVVKAEEPEDQKPTMYCLSVGINYRWDKKLDENLGWLDAAENDARTILTALQTNCTGKGNRFRAVEAAPALVGKAASKTAILNGLKEIREKGAKPGDLVVLFYAGHGVAEGREFYLLTADLDPKAIPNTCLSGSELRQALKAMPCQVLLIFDACQSGRALDKFAAVNDEVGRALADDDAGITVLAAAMAHENAGEKGDNGRLTLALCKTLGLAPGTFFDKESKLMNIRHLHTRVEDIVRNQSKGRQNPVLLAPWSTPPLVIRKIPN